jgi:hypothetical protein
MERQALRRENRRIAMSVTDSRERQRRIAAAWSADPDTELDAITAAVDADLVAEAEARAEQDARTKELDDSYNAFCACPVCGETAQPGRFCGKCGPVVVQVTAERAMTETVRGRTRRELAGAYLDRKGA